jgi:hypothetical protein
LPAEAGSLVVKAIEAVATPEQEKKQAEIQEKDSAESFSEEVEQQEPVLFRELLSHTRAAAPPTSTATSTKNSGCRPKPPNACPVTPVW